ncbi:glutathione S-transferase [Meira miltonrushii]|uniref:Glutathione S-transferase n=1 Tax=Meira miltonrushii TaxID=1280837 RepID=A0A316V2T1_9BASI|nr:glutathione S-transferase [Meira miltonrushii]PWN31830.1 glutathione S-transferase [Meira miltonrushii]
MTSSSSKNDLTFTLHYWPVIPGRGEFIRLAFECVQHPYKENNKSATEAFPAHFAVPLLEIGNVPNLQDSASSNKSQKTQEGQDAKSTSANKSGQSVFISQTAVILSYLAPILGLDGVNSLQEQDPQSIAIRQAQVLQLTATALDLNNEVHDTHHPVASSEVYEDQKDEAARRTADFRKNRLPKFFTHFQTALQNNPANSGWLIGKEVTIADLTLYQVLDGLHFAFPKRIAALKKQGEYEDLFKLHQKVAQLPNIAKYLDSDRRKAYSNGVFRHYPELDGDD